mgnify:CR=1 FL=1
MQINNQRNHALNHPSYRHHVINYLCICLGGFLLASCAHSPPTKLTLSDLGTRFWQDTYYLSVTGQPSSIQCDVNSTYKALDDVFVRYKGQNATALFDSDDDLIKINDLKQKCLNKSIIEAAAIN